MNQRNLNKPSQCQGDRCHCSQWGHGACNATNDMLNWCCDFQMEFDDSHGGGVMGCYYPPATSGITYGEWIDVGIWGGQFECITGYDTKPKNKPGSVY